MTIIESYPFINQQIISFFKEQFNLKVHTELKVSLSTQIFVFDSFNKKTIFNIYCSQTKSGKLLYTFYILDRESSIYLTTFTQFYMLSTSKEMNAYFDIIKQVGNSLGFPLDLSVRSFEELNSTIKPKIYNNSLMVLCDQQVGYDKKMKYNYNIYSSFSFEFNTDHIDVIRILYYDAPHGKNFALCLHSDGTLFDNDLIVFEKNIRGFFREEIIRRLVNVLYYDIKDLRDFSDAELAIHLPLIEIIDFS